MDDKNLFDGIGIVIDDHVFKGEEYNDKILQLVNFLENKKHLPLVKYDKLPEDIDMNALMTVKFLLLDWDLSGLNDDFGLPIQTPMLKKNAIFANVEFIKKITKSIVVPIFIFSNDSVDDIKNKLIEEKILTDNNDVSFPIFIKSKSDLFDENGDCIMFELVNDWVKSTSSIYVIHKWKAAYSNAINNMALELGKTTTSWPNVLWTTFKTDGVNPSEEIATVINQNVLARVQPVIFNEQILNDIKPCDNKILMDILSKQRFIENDNISESSSTGDLYKEKKDYYLNIRPFCDCVGRDGVNEIYLIKGSILSQNKVKTLFKRDYGNFSEQSNTAIVGPINSKCIEFRFKNILIKDYKDFKDKRIGRIIPPFITHITQKYGLYVHRQGLPRIPTEIIPLVEEEKEDDKNSELLAQIECLTNDLGKVQKDNSELQKKIAKLQSQKESQQKPSQKAYTLYNCKVNIVPSLKKRRLKK